MINRLELVRIGGQTNKRNLEVGDDAVVRLLIAAFLLAGFLAQPADAQGRKPFHAMSDAEKADVKAADAVDRQYRNALQGTRKEANEIQMDPWSNMRSTAPATPKKK